MGFNGIRRKMNWIGKLEETNGACVMSTLFKFSSGKLGDRNGMKERNEGTLEWKQENAQVERNLYYPGMAPQPC